MFIYASMTVRHNYLNQDGLLGSKETNLTHLQKLKHYSIETQRLTENKAVFYRLSYANYIIDFLDCNWKILW